MRPRGTVVTGRLSCGVQLRTAYRPQPHSAPDTSHMSSTSRVSPAAGQRQEDLVSQDASKRRRTVRCTFLLRPPHQYDRRRGRGPAKLSAPCRPCDGASGRASNKTAPPRIVGMIAMVVVCLRSAQPASTGRRRGSASIKGILGDGPS